MGWCLKKLGVGDEVASCERGLQGRPTNGACLYIFHVTLPGRPSAFCGALPNCALSACTAAFQLWLCDSFSSLFPLLLRLHRRPRCQQWWKSRYPLMSSWTRHLLGWTCCRQR